MSRHKPQLASIRSFVQDEEENFFSYSIEKIETHSVTLFSDESDLRFKVDFSGTNPVFSSSSEELIPHVRRLNSYVGENPSESMMAYLVELGGYQLEDGADGMSEDLAESDLDDADMLDDEDEGEAMVIEGLSDDEDDIFGSPVEPALIPGKTSDYDREMEVKRQFGVDGRPSMAINRLVQDYLYHSTTVDSDEIGFVAEPIGSDLFSWRVKLYNFDKKTDPIAADLGRLKSSHGLDHIEILMKFPPEYPIDPPFIRVIKPRMKYRTGHITVGGSLCMIFLTKSGWQPTYSIEAVLVQVRLAIVGGGCRVDFANPMSEYTEHEARSAFTRVAQFHGWDV